MWWCGPSLPKICLLLDMFSYSAHGCQAKDGELGNCFSLDSCEKPADSPALEGRCIAFPTDHPLIS
jgi:hypothetical protein